MLGGVNSAPIVTGPPRPLRIPRGRVSGRRHRTSRAISGVTDFVLDKLFRLVILGGNRSRLGEIAGGQ